VFRFRKVTLKECAPEIRNRIDEVFGRLISLVARVGTVVDEKVTRAKWPDTIRTHAVPGNAARLNLLLADKMLRAIGEVLNGCERRALPLDPRYEGILVLNA
jgi:hypothetical protein